MTETDWKPDLKDKALYWWREMQDMLNDGKTPNPGADRAGRARLRRIDPSDVIVDEAIIRLYRRLHGDKAAYDEGKMKPAVRVALVLAHVRSNSRADFAAALGDGGENAKLKPLRFKRLLQAEDEADIIREFRRAVDLLGNEANVRELADILLTWERDATRTRFAFSYFGARAASPAENADLPAETV